MTTQEALTSSQFCIFRWERAVRGLPRHIVCFHDSSIANVVSAGLPTRSTIYFMFFVYILQSQSTQRFYIGCAEDILVRLAEHQRKDWMAMRSLLHQTRKWLLTSSRPSLDDQRDGHTYRLYA